MCSPVACKTCGKTTWAGCGQHVADVRKRVPADQWCDGHGAVESSSGGLFGRLFGKARA